MFTEVEFLQWVIWLIELKESTAFVDCSDALSFAQTRLSELESNLILENELYEEAQAPIAEEV